VSAFFVGLIDRFSGGGNRVTNNRVNEGHYGIWSQDTADDTISNNTLVNVNVLLTSDPYAP
jgi:parallel beta-helix repeat protein